MPPSASPSPVPLSATCCDGNDCKNTRSVDHNVFYEGVAVAQCNSCSECSRIYNMYGNTAGNTNYKHVCSQYYWEHQLGEGTPCVWDTSEPDPSKKCKEVWMAQCPTSPPSPPPPIPQCCDGFDCKKIYEYSFDQNVFVGGVAVARCTSCSECSRMYNMYGNAASGVNYQHICSQYFWEHGFSMITLPCVWDDAEADETQKCKQIWDAHCPS